MIAEHENENLIDKNEQLSTLTGDGSEATDPTVENVFENTQDQSESAEKAEPTQQDEAPETETEAEPEVEPELEVEPEPETVLETTSKAVDATATESVGSTLAKSAGGIVLKASHLAIAVVLVAALTVGGVFFGMWLKDRESDPDIDPNAKDYGDIYFGEEAEEGNITAPGYADISLPANTRKVQMILPNPSHNPCYFRYTLVIKDSGETVYRSGLIPPGKAVTDLTLSRPLDAGTYTLEILIDTFSLDTRSAMNGIQMEVTLTAK